MKVTVVGVDHRIASADVRGHLHLDGPDTVALLGRIRETFPGCEALVLSTCNRTELWFVERDGHNAAGAWHLLLEGCTSSAEESGDGRPSCDQTGVMRRRIDGADAADHIFRVAAGLDSAVLGDAEILGQIRAARSLAVRAGTMGKHLHRLVEMALANGKSVRSRTSIGAGGAGIGSAATSLVSSRVDAQDPVLVVGAGVIAHNVVMGLHKRGFRHIRIVNRTRAHAERIASKVGVGVGDHGSLIEEMARASAVIVAVGGGVRLSASDLDEVTVRRGSRHPLVVVDASLPTVVEPHPDIDLVTIDGIGEHRDRALMLRQRAVCDAERIVDEGLQDWMHWLACADLDEEIAALYASAERVVRSVAERHGHDHAHATRRALRRQLHVEVTNLRHEHLQELLDAKA